MNQLEPDRQSPAADVCWFIIATGGVSVQAEAIPGFLQQARLRLLLFGGKGGVGKTTCAVAAALSLARQHPAQSFLLVSTDPAHSLLDCFAGSAPLPNLTICEIDPQQSLLRFKQRNQQHLRTIALRGTFLDQSDIDELVDLSIPGLDELMALLEIEAWIKQDQYACIVVDTAPAGHTLRLLGLPALMLRWVDALDAMLAKYRYMVQLYRGAYCKDEVDVYLDDTLSDLSNLWALLRSPEQCRFVPVMLAEALSIHVSELMLHELERLGLPVQEVVVNRLLGPQANCPHCTEQGLRQVAAIDALTHIFSKYVFWGLPLFLDDVLGTERLLTLWEQARPLAPVLLDACNAAPYDELACAPEPVLVSNPAPMPSASLKLILFAGKGGVGKTTLACASALRLADERSSKQILLFSIDPAHSLGACLGYQIGSQETRVAPGLTVIELDALAEYDTLKKIYADELRGVLDRGESQAGVDLAFDREVMERMLDVAPPGLDEMLALTRILDLMDRNRYDLFVLDTAPTGHLIRFLEMPELIEKWLKAFFSLFLKYRNIFWLPKIVEVMTNLSSKMKIFKRMLTDVRQSMLIAVTIPTEMAFSETGDLFAACERLGVAVPVLFVNMVTPPSSCPTCAVLHRAQQVVLDRYQQACAPRHLGLVFRQQEPHGFARLRELGAALYQTQHHVNAISIQGKELP
jgi:arsenite-transporting ATPase